MAKTLSYGDALNVVGKQVPRQYEEDLAAHCCNLANNLIWNKYDWRESIADLLPFYLIPGQQDYGKPFVAVPADFQGLRTANFVQMSSSPPIFSRMLIVRDLDETYIQQPPSSIAYNKERQAFRLFPRTPVNMGGPDYLVNGTYKKLPTLVTASTLASTKLPYEDQYFNVFCQALKWSMLDTFNSESAGNAQIVNGQAQYSGQLAKAMTAIEEMATNEGLNLGDPVVAPKDALVGPSVGRLMTGIGPIGGYW